MILACCQLVAILFGLVILKLVEGVFWCIKALWRSVASCLGKMRGEMSCQIRDCEEEPLPAGSKPVPMNETEEEPSTCKGTEYHCQEKKRETPISPG